MRLYSGEQPIHTAFNIGSRVCLTSIHEYLQHVVKNNTLQEPEQTHPLPHQIKEEIPYITLTGSLKHNDREYKITLFTGNPASKDVIFFHYCGTLGIAPRNKSTYFDRGDLQSMYDKIYSGDKLSEYFVFCSTPREAQLVQRALNREMGPFTVDQPSTECSIPKLESDPTLHTRVLCAGETRFLAYWIEGELKEGTLGRVAYDVIYAKFRPSGLFSLSTLKEFEEQYTQEHLQQLRATLHRH